MNGISQAATDLSGHGCTTSPKCINIVREEYSQPGILGSYFPGTRQRRPVHKIEFDIAVTVTEGKETKGGIGVAMGIVAVGSKGESSSEANSISRLKFIVPVVLPVGDEDFDTTELENKQIQNKS